MADENENNQEEQVLNDKIDELIQYEPDDLGEENKKFLEEHKDLLTEEELTKYGFTKKEGDGTGTGKPADKKEDNGAGNGEQVVPIDAEKTEVQLREAYGVDDSDLDEDQKKVLAKVAGPFKAQQDALARQEIVTLVASNPIFKPYQALIEKYAKAPEYKNVPVDIIAKALAFDDAVKFAAKNGAGAEKLAAQRNARRGTPGNARRGGSDQQSGLPDTTKMTDKEFEKHVNDVKSGKYANVKSA